MNGAQIEDVVRREIGNGWDATNSHGVVLRDALVRPKPAVLIERVARKGETHERLVDAWIVLVEDPGSETGYRVVADRDGRIFGLASEGLPTDARLVLCGWHGGFLDAFHGM